MYVIIISIQLGYGVNIEIVADCSEHQDIHLEQIDQIWIS